ncbi:MAG: leucyl aminopeptidase, partial [Alphaproteobacteria bacterium]
MRIEFTSPQFPASGALVVFAAKGADLAASAAEVDRLTSGALGRAIKASRYDGSRGDVVEILAPSGLDASRVILVGLGTPGELTPVEFEKIGGQITARLLTSGEARVTVLLD